MSKSDASLNFNSTLGIENAREVINGFVEELNRSLTRKNRLNKDFVTKSSLYCLIYRLHIECPV